MHTVLIIPLCNVLYFLVADFAAPRSCGGNTNLRDGSRCSNSILMEIMLPSILYGSRLGRKGVLFFFIVEKTFPASIWMRHCKDQFSYSCQSLEPQLVPHCISVLLIFATPGSTLIRLVGDSLWTLVKTLLTPLLSQRAAMTGICKQNIQNRIWNWIKF